jgi:cupin 2 domain-containing protein
MKNIFDIKEPISSKEVTKTILEAKNIRIERIVSNGEVSPKDFWYNQDKDEWVCLVQGSAILEFEKDKEVKLEEGDFLFIPAYKKHRVSFVSKDPNCIWIAVHGEFNI